LELAKDQKWLHRATLAINQHWQRRNARKSDPPASASGLPMSAAA
jgi:hypothetical protein